ncbi:MAG: secretin N-terminal domain-containing protein [Negativicutes bacterium]|nr:secretin N-terminal domain-containing protein [Negativicutes bacterium]
MHQLKRNSVLTLFLIVIILSLSLVAWAAPPSRPWASADSPDGQPVPATGGTTPSAVPSAPAAVAPSAPAAAPAPGQVSAAPPPPAGFFGQRPLVIRLKYLRADQAKTLLTMLVPEDRIRLEPTNNTIIVLGSSDDYDQVSDLLAKVDVPPRQVMFEAEIIEISRDDSKSIGINWGDSHVLPSTPSTTVNTGSTGEIVSGSYTSTGAARVSLGIKNHPELGFDLQATINHKISEQKARVLASPRIAALDGQTASIIIGDDLAIQQLNTYTGGSSTTVVYKSVNIKLEVTPFVNDDGTITTHLKPEVSNPTTYDTAGNPNIRTRQADTTLRVKSGETIVLGGLIQRESTQTATRFPFLSDIPLVGRLFRSTDSEKKETELVILITPKIISD